MPDTESPAPVDYGLAIHYRESGAYGDSWATLRLFVDGAAVYERAGVRLSEGDLWQVGTIRTPGWAVEEWTSPEGADSITADYAPDWW